MSSFNQVNHGSRLIGLIQYTTILSDGMFATSRFYIGLTVDITAM